MCVLGLVSSSVQLLFGASYESRHASASDADDRDILLAQRFNEVFLSHFQSVHISDLIGTIPKRNAVKEERPKVWQGGLIGHMVDRR